MLRGRSRRAWLGPGGLPPGTHRLSDTVASGFEPRWIPARTASLTLAANADGGCVLVEGLEPATCEVAVACGVGQRSAQIGCLLGGRAVAGQRRLFPADQDLVDRPGAGGGPLPGRGADGAFEGPGRAGEVGRDRLAVRPRQRLGEARVAMSGDHEVVPDRGSALHPVDPTGRMVVRVPRPD